MHSRSLNFYSHHEQVNWVTLTTEKGRMNSNKQTKNNCHNSLETFCSEKISSSLWILRKNAKVFNDGSHESKGNTPRIDPCQIVIWLAFPLWTREGIMETLWCSLICSQAIRAKFSGVVVARETIVNNRSIDFSLFDLFLCSTNWINGK